MTDGEDLPELVRRLGPDARWARVVVSRLAAGPATVDELVRASGLSRRTVEGIVRAVGDAGAELPPESEADRSTAERTRLPRLEIDGELVRTIADLVGREPPARRVLDQVQADPETVVARAAFLRDQFDLSGGLLVLGDHDLTSIASVLLMPALDVTVADIDEPLLEFVDTVARDRRLAVRTVFVDLRDGLPEFLRQSASIVFTDPPYSPDGVARFLECGLAALDNRERGRVVVAYGAGDHRPDLALAVQDRVNRLRVVIEAVYPSFNSYALAHAIGGWSDLYVCRPTAGTWRRLGRADAPRSLYTRGPQSEESTPPPAAAALDAAVALVPDGEVTDLRNEPDELLLRALLATTSPRAIVVRNNHRDIVDERSQRALLDLVASTASVRFHRSTPDASTAIVTAHPVDGVSPRATTTSVSGVPLAHVPRHRLAEALAG